MSDFLRDHLERRRDTTRSTEDSAETAELLSSLNSNIGLVANSTSSNDKTSKRILGTIESQVVIERQRDVVYSKFSKEQVVSFKIFADEQKSQTKTISKGLQDLNRVLSQDLGKKLADISKYLRPDNTHSKRKDEAKAIAERSGLKAKESTKDSKSKRSIVDDALDLFDFDDDKKKDKSKNRQRKYKKVGRTVGMPGSTSVKSGGWWDAIKGKVSGAGEAISETAGKSGNGLKGLFKGIPGALSGGASVVGKLAAPVGAALDVGMGVNDLLDGKRQTEMPSGWDMLSPMRWGMYGGEKINQGYEAGSTALGGSGNMIEDGVNGVKALGSVGNKAILGASDLATSVSKSVSTSFNNNIIPGFSAVTSNFGRYTESLETSTSSLLTGLSKTFSDFGDEFKQGASAVYSGAKRAVSAASTYAGEAADNAVKKITGNKEATVGSVASGVKEKAGNFFKGLGGTSAQFESGKEGTKAIGWDPTGGTSYGKYQIAAKTGTSKEFLDFVKQRGGNDDIHEKLSKAGFDKDTGSKKGAAVDAWKELASSQGSGERLSELEHKFIEQKKFMPAVNKAKDLGFATDDKGVQDAIWSASVQHGKVNKEILGKVAQDPNFKSMSSEDQIKALYNRRSEYVDGLKNVDKSAGRGRYEKEVKVALAKSAEGKSAGPGLVENPEVVTSSFGPSEPVKAAQKPTTKVAALGSPKTKDTENENEISYAEMQARSSRPLAKGVDKSMDKEYAEAYAEAKALSGRVTDEKGLDVKTSKQGMQLASADPLISSVKREPQRMVDPSSPVESAPVAVTNTEQMSPKVEVTTPQPSVSSPQQSAVPTLDSTPLQLTDFGLVLLNIGHV